jgi:cytochrome d ubiquinol oxidase subunit I
MVFWSFRVMLGMGMLMLLVSWWAAFQLIRGRGINKTLLLVLSAMTFSGWVATLAGWYVTEIGRQPWIVYGLLRSADVVADHSSATVANTLLGYIGLYLFLLVSYIQALRYLASKPAQSMTLLRKNSNGAAVGEAT